ncbi:hypothetical protein [Maledivibacter halophilus]|uniref:Uncharacterized protein n=1 Tax=Maledivibacter halophilus TaxID=36842 RepID=A0A1T5M2F0_9FIRM|nr:hypothetical protein [Maledivibacter halophilus]SKC81938.1 hypothetical protein SAMN02194393_03681 [Maledivibacter halophilus]
MNYKVISKMSCKIISIYMFFKFITAFQSFFYVFYPNSQAQIEQNSVFFFLPFIISLFLSIILWVFADKISSYMVKEPTNSSNNVKVDYIELQAIAFSVVGITVLVNSIPQIIRLGIDMKTIVSNDIIANWDMLLRTTKSQMIGYIIKTILGLWLLFGSNGIVGLVKTLRTAGVKGPNDE